MTTEIKEVNKPETVVYLSIREWLELGQAFNDICNTGPKYFTKFQTDRIVIGNNCKLKADGKVYKEGVYKLNADYP